jgi:hypothetical protein
VGGGGWGLGVGPQPPNPQSPIPNPQSPIPILILNIINFKNKYLKLFNYISYLILINKN